jgi:hypothetical protein
VVFSQSRAYQEIFGLGEARKSAKVDLRQLARRCGTLSDATTARIQALSLELLEALAARRGSPHADQPAGCLASSIRS